MRDQHGLLSEDAASRVLAQMNANDVRSAATECWRDCGVVGADWDGSHLTLLRNGRWGPQLHRDMNRALERFINSKT